MMDGMVLVVAVIVFLLLLFAAVLALAAQSWLRRWQVELVRRQQLVTDAAISAARAERAEHAAATVDAVVTVAADKLGSQLQLGTQHVELRNNAIEERLAGMNDELRRVNDLVATLQKERAEQHGQLLNGLQEQARQSAELARSAQNLQHALANPKARGQWGERMAEDVLRLAGLVEGVNYRKQVAIAGGTIPDFTFLLPNGWNLHMDVKFPIDNYLRMLGAATDSDRSSHAAQFARDVRARIKELHGRNYIQRGETVDYVLAFIPNEAVYGFIHEQDPALVDDALRQKVVLCSPFTLFAVLAVVRQSVEHVALERTSDEILRVLGGFTQQWEKFSDSVDGLGRKLDTAQKAFEELAGPRRRQLQRHLDKVDDLRTRSGLDELVAGPPGPAPLRAVSSGG
ncbi:MAG: DNA recombination protein RmuC [Acidimicrobiales bacterium]|nr:DNA recombination protein RmuC [Acidimicrobiales bacterium]